MTKNTCWFNINTRTQKFKRSELKLKIHPAGFPTTFVDHSNTTTPNISSHLSLNMEATLSPSDSQACMTTWDITVVNNVLVIWMPSLRHCTAVKSKISLSAETFYRGKLRKTVCRYSNPKSYHEKRHIFRKHIWNSSNFFDIFSFFIFPCFAVEKVDRASSHFSKLFQTSKKKPNYIMAGFIRS